MGFIRNLFTKVAGSPPTDWTFVPSVPTAGFTPEPITPDECYVQLKVESARLAKSRKFATRFHGVVYSFVSLPRQGEPSAEFAAVSKPDKLAALDAQAVNRVLTISKDMLNAVPWRGGSFGLELGLFSVKSGNLVTPVLDYVARVSSTAGASFVGAVKPFLPLITEGMDLVAGQSEETQAEIALDTDIALTQSGYYAVIATPKDSLDIRKLSCDASDGKLLLDGVPLDLGYCVFSIRTTKQKVDFGEIPELKDAFGAVRLAIRNNKRTDAEEALAAFRRAAVTSPDLIRADADKLIRLASDMVRDAFGATGIASAGGREIGDLGQLPLYR